MSALGLAYVFVRRSWVMKQDAGDGKMKEISNHIYEGALVSRQDDSLGLMAIRIKGLLIKVASVHLISIRRYCRIPT